MKDIQVLIEACRKEETGRPMALATVVKVEGSAYRRPGARMLIRTDGSRVGSVSGGCLEADVVQRSRQVIDDGTSEYVLYDSRRSNGDLVAELGCKGAIGILIEPVCSPEVRASLDFLNGFLQTRGQGAQATLFRGEGEVPIPAGSRLMRNAQGALTGALAAEGMTDLLLPDLEHVLQTGHAETRTLHFPGGSAEFLLEPVQSPVALLICGAGQDAVPLAQMALSLGWQVTVIDHRYSMLSPERFPGVKTRLLSRCGALKEFQTADARTAVVLMSHNYMQDREGLRTLLASPPPYIGLLGPRKRAEQMLTELHEDGFVPDAECLARLYSPAGLDIGSETPEEIAFAILGEIQAALSRRSGGFLRERKGPIHCAP